MIGIDDNEQDSQKAFEASNKLRLLTYDEILALERTQYENAFAGNTTSPVSVYPRTIGLLDELLATYQPTKKQQEQLLEDSEGSSDMSVAIYQTKDPAVYVKVLHTGDNWNEIGRPTNPGAIRRFLGPAIISFVKYGSGDVPKPIPGPWEQTSPAYPQLEFSGGRPGYMLPDISQKVNKPFDWLFTMDHIQVLRPNK